MKVGDVIAWKWYGGMDGNDLRPYSGMIVSSRLAKTDWQKLIIYDVLEPTGLIVDVRSDNEHLEVISESR